MFAKGALVACLPKVWTLILQILHYRIYCDNHSNISILRNCHALRTLACGMMCYRIGGSTRT